jgi:hypothetical protein
MYMPAKTPEIAQLLAAVPGLRGKRSADIRVLEFRGPQTVNSYWSGGSRAEYVLVNLITRETWSVPTSHPYFDRADNGDRCGNLELRELPPDTCLISGGIFCGKPGSIAIHVRPENMTAMLPAPGPELSAQQKSALDVICTIRGGARRDEFDRRSLGAYGADNPHVSALLAAGLAKKNKAGAVSVTTDGRNANT